ncbi:O-antigen ligase-like membrane protein [Chitinophaga niastensis]|uniref:O-antigen ligase-like membrane protein n=1 Tax=Chitinophaga niastensis TaxID=536980 RepID=A0A2P8HCA4_CHINA|nr:O-antigen ligase family protein [Chitinophaga niastensis]PSL43751.1 O-antigen ligase-like membrane protein [Chitinophaga niastensis]
MPRGKKNILNYLIIVLWILAIPAIAYISSLDYKISVAVFAGVVGLVVAVISLLNYRAGYYILITVSLSVHALERMSGAELPVGIFLDGLLLTILMGIIFDKKVRTKSNIDYLRDPLLLILYLYTCYLLIQCFNPNMFSMQGWVVYIRVFIRNLIFLFITMRMINSWQDVHAFFKFWLTISTLAALYGCLQQIVGLLPFEQAYINRYPDKFITVMIQGRPRIFSFMADPAAFGVLMACGAIIGMVLLTAGREVISMQKKCLLLFMTGVHLLALGFSGTRTAYVMLPMGLMLFFLVNLHNRNTIIAACISVMGMLALLFGPFYGNATVVRIRSAFVGTKDESLNLRDVNRHSVQPYIYAHPIGGGIMTTGNDGTLFNPGHPLAGFQTDSGYLHTVLELGWIGLIIICLYMYIGLQYAVSNYFKNDDPLNKLLLIGIASVMFAIIVAQYAQEAAGLVETSLFLNALLAISVKIKYNLNNSKQ